MCRGDDVVYDGNPEVDYPRVPGHELAGTVDAVGTEVTAWTPGDRVGVGWHGGHCFTCEACRRGDFVRCGDKPITGLHRDGGYAEYALARAAGFETVAVSRGPDKRSAALDLGADHYVDSEAEDPAAALQDLGGADLVLSTAPASDPVAAIVEGVGADGEVLNVGVPEEPVPVNVGHLAATRGSVSGWAAGSP